MSVVIMVKSGKELFLFGDKKTTHINNFDKENESYEVESVSYDAQKVYKIKDDIIVGMVGSSLGYNNLFQYVIHDQKVDAEVANEIKDYKDFVADWLNYQFECLEEYLKDDTKHLEIEKMFGAIVCGINDGKFYTTSYGYPADEGARATELVIDKDGTIVLSQMKYRSLYAEYYQKFYTENGGNVFDAIENTLKTMSKIDDSISEQFDVVKISLE